MLDTITKFFKAKLSIIPKIIPKHIHAKLSQLLIIDITVINSSFVHSTLFIARFSYRSRRPIHPNSKKLFNFFFFFPFIQWLQKGRFEPKCFQSLMKILGGVSHLIQKSHDSKKLLYRLKFFFVGVIHLWMDNNNNTKWLIYIYSDYLRN